MKIFTTRQIAEIDRYTIEHEPIADIDLMERASMAIAERICSFVERGNKITVFAGPGNNGGDALAVSRMLADEGFDVVVCIPDFGRELSGSPLINLNQLEQQAKATIKKISGNDPLPELSAADIIVDGMFGSGLTRPLTGLASGIVQHINSSKARVIAVDIPSGLMGEDNSDNDLDSVIKADITLTLQFPKLSFFFPENDIYVGAWEVLPIGLHSDAIKGKQTPWRYIDEYEVYPLLKYRRKFSHKGTFGHALLISGSYGKMGAAVLASRGCLRSGVGLLTTHVPRLGYQIIQNTTPEAMASIDQSDLMFTEFKNPISFSAVGIGPGLGVKSNTKKGLCELLQNCEKPMVIDADALNILAGNKEWMELLPENSILTPHPGEFARLTGNEDLNGMERVLEALRMAEKFNVYFVLKGAHTAVACPDGTCWFNSTGNPGLATAGSGDVLTGIITGLVAQGYDSIDAALLGTYLHGLSADIYAEEYGEESLVAGDIIDNLGAAFETLKNKNL
jgi:NAD(P)H-hydrate epimerase